jgi:hypothetical protein
MPQYALARHVFVCVKDEHVVFLDLRQDRYFALESTRTTGLGGLVPGWPVSDSSTVSVAQGPEDGATPAVLTLLMDKGILVPEGKSGKAAAPILPEELRGDLTAEDPDVEPQITVMTCCRFVAAVARAALMLKYRTLESVIDRVAQRASGGRPLTRQPLDMSRAQTLVGTFAALRPFFFTTKDACLFDALALSEFLAGYGIYPRWIFGVQTRPFAAHCWLQLEGIVFNDTVEHVKRYQPIMVV